MGIPILCTCGRRLSVPDDSAGKEYRCPYCEHFVYIPTPKEDRGLFRWNCECGQRLKARRVSAGRAINCPRCGERCTVPTPTSIPDDDESEASAILLEEDAKAIAEETMTCSECGMQLATDQEECPECGAPLLDEDEEAAHSETRVIREEVYTEDEDEEESRVRDLLNPADGADAGAEPSEMIDEAVRAGVSPEVAAAVEEDSDEEEVAPGGLSGTNLSVYFNTSGGIEAAKAGVLQLFHVLPACVACAGLAWVLYGLHVLAGTRWAESPTHVWLVSVAAGLGLLALLTGFVGCIRDGVFQRSVGIERLVQTGTVRLPMFVLALVLTVPLWGACAFGGRLLFDLIQSMQGGLPVRVLPGIGAALVAVIVFEWVILVAMLTVLEKTHPFEALHHAVQFIRRRFLSLVAMSATLVLVGGGTVGLFLLAGHFLRPRLAGIPPVAVTCAVELVAALVATAVLGWLLASVMLLYLSHVDDEEKLQGVHSYCTGPKSRAWLLWVAIAVIYAGAIAGCLYRARPANPTLPGPTRTEVSETNRS